MKAKERSRKENLEHLVEFRAGDAYDVPFGDNEFHIVITEFVTISWTRRELLENT